MATKTKTSISLYPDTLALVKERGEEVSPTVDRDLNRLYTLYDRALRQIDLSVSEACLICDCLNATIMDAKSAPMLWAEIEDANNLDRLDEKWEIDGPALVEKLKNMTEIQCLAIIDAAERFWQDETSRDKGMKGFVTELFKIRKFEGGNQ